MPAQAPDGKPTTHASADTQAVRPARPAAGAAAAATVLLMIGGLFAGLVVIQDVQGAAPTGWTEEIPGVATGVFDVAIAGSNTEIGIAYQSSGAMGFVLRTTGWAVKTSDISGNVTAFVEPQLCYTGPASWVLAARFGTSVGVYQSSDNGATWALKLWVTNTAWDGDIDCLTGSIWAIVYSDTDVAPDTDVFFRKTVDGGATWSAPFELFSTTGVITGSSLAYESTSKVVAVMDADNGNTATTTLRKSDDGGLFWTTGISIDTTSVVAGSGGSHAIDLERGTNFYAASHNPEEGGEGGLHYFIGTYANDLNADHRAPDFPGSQTSDNNFCGDTSCSMSMNLNDEMLMSQRLGNGGSTVRTYYVIATTPGTASQTLDVNIGGTHRDFDVFLGETIAVFVYRDAGQGNRLETRVATVVPPEEEPGDPTGDFARIAIAGGTGLSVDPTGLTGLVRTGTLVHAFNGGNLFINGFEDSECSQFGGVDALDLNVAFVANCSGTKTFEIRNRALGLPNIPEGCDPADCRSTFSTEGLDIQDMSTMVGFRFNFEAFDNIPNFLLPDPDQVVLAWAFTSFDGQIGVFLKVFKNINPDIIKIAGFNGVGDGIVDDMCFWRHNNQFWVVGAEAGISPFRFNPQISFDRSRDGQILSASLSTGSLVTFGASYSQMNSVDCAGQYVIFSGGGDVVIVNVFAQQPFLFDIFGVATQPKGVTMSDDGRVAYYADGNEIVGIARNGTLFEEFGRFPMAPGTFREITTDQTGRNVWHLTTEYLQRNSLDSFPAANPPRHCSGLTGTALTTCLEGNPLCDLDTDGDGIKDCQDPDIDNDGTPNDSDNDDDGDGVIDCLDTDHPSYGNCSAPGTGGSGGAGGSGLLNIPASVKWIASLIIILLGLATGWALTRNARNGPSPLIIAGTGGLGLAFASVFAGLDFWIVVVVVLIAAASVIGGFAIRVRGGSDQDGS